MIKTLSFSTPPQLNLLYTSKDYMQVMYDVLTKEFDLVPVDDNINREYTPIEWTMEGAGASSYSSQMLVNSFLPQGVENKDGVKYLTIYCYWIRDTRPTTYRFYTGFLTTPEIFDDFKSYRYYSENFKGRTSMLSVNIFKLGEMITSNSDGSSFQDINFILKKGVFSTSLWWAGSCNSSPIIIQSIANNKYERKSYTGIMLNNWPNGYYMSSSFEPPFDGYCYMVIFIPEKGVEYQYSSTYRYGAYFANAMGVNNYTLQSDYDTYTPKDIIISHICQGYDFKGVVMSPRNQSTIGRKICINDVQYLKIQDGLLTEEPE